MSGEETGNPEAAAPAEVPAVEDPPGCKGKGEAEPVQKETHETPRNGQANLKQAPAEHNESKDKKLEHAKTPATKCEEPKRDQKFDASILVALKL